MIRPTDGQSLPVITMLCAVYATASKTNIYSTFRFFGHISIDDAVVVEAKSADKEHPEEGAENVTENAN